MPYIFLGTADDKSQQYPYAPTTRHAAELKTLLVMNAVLSPPIVIEEGFLLAAGETLSLGATGSVLIDAVSSGLVKIMSRSSDLERYAGIRRKKRHAAPPDTEEGRAFLSRLQQSCVNAQAFISYPPPSIDHFTFERLHALSQQKIMHEIFDLNRSELNEFPDIFERQYKTGLEGQRWTARSAWEAAALELFHDNVRAVHALMALANRQRQLIRGSSLASSLGKPVIVETGFELGGDDLIQKDTTIEQGITVRRSGRRRLAEQLPMRFLIDQYRQVFAALADQLSPVSQKKSEWINASERVAYTENSDGAIDAFIDATDAYAAALMNLDVAGGGNDQPIQQGDNINALDFGYGVAIPASMQILSATNVSRRELLLHASGLGVLFGADYVLRPWSMSTDHASRSRLILSKQKISNLDHVGGLSEVRTNFHERVVVPPGRVQLQST